jgi:pyridoxine 5-phosphate synthase
VNIDHVATVHMRVAATRLIRAGCDIGADAGADSITAHLREDRRHIGDTDIDA